MTDLNLLVDTIADRVAERVGRQLSRVAPTTAPRLLTIEAAATYLSRTPPAVRHLIAAGKLPQVRIDNRIFLDVRDLDRVIEDSKRVL